MCGIIGFTGQENSVPILLSGLYALEYRGYDSSGISVFTEGRIITEKTTGRISNLEAIISEREIPLHSDCGIGHTRWATHGKPSDLNSHPHCTENLSLVHNGIIENYAELKKELQAEGEVFKSETDTEVAAHLIDIEYRKFRDPHTALRNALRKIEGSYAFGIIFKDHPGKIFAARKNSPLLVASGYSGNLIASDILAIIKYSQKFIRLDDYDTAIISKEKIEIFDKDGNPSKKEYEEIGRSYEKADKNGFEHYMLKEIYEEPEAILKTISGRIQNGIPNFFADGLSAERIEKIGRIHIVACGTAMHAGLMGKYFMENFAKIPAEVEIASEFRYRNPILQKNDIFIALSQSGETADTLAALRLAREMGLYTISVVNVSGSTIAMESDEVIYTLAGPEIAVASTKAYTVQCVVMYLLALELAYKGMRISESSVKEATNRLINEIPKKLSYVLTASDKISDISRRISECENMFFIGRGIDYALSMEASLKLKEISYIHSEAYAAGELKHGTISLITEGTVVVAIATDKSLFEKTCSNIKEVRARGAYVILLCGNDIDVSDGLCDSIIKVPHTDTGLTSLCVACAFQLLAYHTARIRGCDIDKPRNLAKSVTVE